MSDYSEKAVKVSVRNLIEFILRSGDIDKRHGGMRDSGAMQEGSRLHRKLQKNMAGNYSPEVPLSITLPIRRKECSFPLVIEGRADGIITAGKSKNAFLPDPFEKSLLDRVSPKGWKWDGIQTNLEDFLDFSQPEQPNQEIAKNIQKLSGTDSVKKEPDPAFEMENRWKKADFLYKGWDSATQNGPKRTAKKNIKLPSIVVDEIKGIYHSLRSLQNPIPMHRYQALCYAYIYAKQHTLNTIGIQITYCHIPSGDIRRFHEIAAIEELETWFLKLTDEYAKWIVWQILWRRQRDSSLKGMSFPFPYRPGQREFVEGVYSTIYHKKKLYLQAPTGTGKTMSTLFPSVMSLSTGLSERIFYLTAKTITRTVAEEACSILMEKGARLKVLTITAKEKICPIKSLPCHHLPCTPTQCERARGHFDRINEAVYALLNSDLAITRDVISKFAIQYCVCPFEMALDTAVWCDIIICDYNYLFDPKVCLKRFFSDDKPIPYTFLVDEAHNLVERARDMYSAILYKEEFLSALPYIQGFETPIPSKLEACDRAFLRLKKECDIFTVLDNIQEIVLPVMQALDELEAFLQDHAFFEHRDALLELYFHIRHFLNIYDLCTKKYRIYADYDENGRFFIMIRCMDPSDNIGNCLMRGSSSILFSATLLPMSYYQEQLAGSKEDYAMYLPSPFPKEHSRILIAQEVSTRYTMRIEEEFQKIAAYILGIYDSHAGNYMVFFPSYQMMEILFLRLKNLRNDIVYLCQKPSMSEEERETFLSSFVEEPEKPVLALCIMGGIFSEGIDLKYSRLIGTVIVGPGLPMVCNERELYKSYFDENGKNGFDYAYLYPGLNKVFQAAGRVIRTDGDRGMILLLDDRFLTNSYRSLFPAEWEPERVTLGTLKKKVKDFWGS